MATEIKITFTKGSFLGEDRVFALDNPVRMGRSHDMDVRLNAEDVSISGNHLEIRAEDNGVYAVCHGKNGFVVNGTNLPKGARHALRPDDVVELGKNERFRVDSVSYGAAREDPATGVTHVADDAVATAATHVAQTDTFATVSTGGFMDSETQPYHDDTPTDDDPVLGGETMPIPEDETGPYEREGNEDDRATGSITGNSLTSDALTSSDTPTEPPPAGSGTTDISKNGPGTFFWDPKKVKEEADRIKANERFKKKMIALLLMIAVALLGVLAFVYWPKEEKWIVNPRIEGTGKPDKVRYHFYSDRKTIDFHVDWARCSGKNIYTNGAEAVEVSTYVGLNRNVPFRLSFIRRIDRKQLELSLDECLEGEMRTLEGKGYSFVKSDEDVVESPDLPEGVSFYELRHPDFSQTQEGQGTLFAQREYIRKDANLSWHGVMILFRDRDRVFRLLREIPNDKWAKGKYLLRMDPNLALYTPFIESRWESPGRAGLLPEGERTPDRLDRLFREAEALLQLGRPDDWPEAARRIDSLMVLTFSGTEADRKRARKLLFTFRKMKDDAYNAMRFDYARAWRNLNAKEAEEVWRKCRGAFSRDVRDVRSQLVNDPKVWSWQLKRSR